VCGRHLAASARALERAGVERHRVFARADQDVARPFGHSSILSRLKVAAWLRPLVENPKPFGANKPFGNADLQIAGIVLASALVRL